MREIGQRWRARRRWVASYCPLHITPSHDHTEDDCPRACDGSQIERRTSVGPRFIADGSSAEIIVTRLRDAAHHRQYGCVTPCAKCCAPHIQRESRAPCAAMCCVPLCATCHAVQAPFWRYL